MARHAVIFICAFPQTTIFHEHPRLSTSRFAE
ncbi:membrane protein [Moniliophthora roreri]|nr:membrane protein [Moniliophthora roreri]